MVWIDALLAFAVAAAVCGLVAGLFRWRHPTRPGLWPTLVFVFLVVFLTAWAGGVWIAPGGPELWGVAFVPFLLVGVLAALMLLASGGFRGQPREGEERVSKAQEAAWVGVAFGIFFWALVLCLIAAIAVRYASRLRP